MGTYNYKAKVDYWLFVPELSGCNYRDDYFDCTYGHITIKKGYCWNGCTAAPDTPKTYIASMVHDSLYQYGKQLNLKRIVADKWFRHLLKRESFKFSSLYYWGVRLFGWMFY